KKNPEAAVDATMKVKPDLNRNSQLDQLKVDIELMDSANVKGRTGYGAEKDWEQTLALLKQYRDVQTDKPWTAFHTNEFLPNAASNCTWRRRSGWSKACSRSAWRHAPTSR